MSHVEDRHKLASNSISFFKTIEQVCSVLNSLLNEYKRSTCTHDKYKSPNLVATPTLDDGGTNRRNITSDSIKSSDNSDENALSSQISKHQEQKESFLKACTLARRNAENFLKYIARCIQYLTNDSSTTYQNAESRIKAIMDDLLKQENSVLEFWAEKKKRLDHCKQYILVEHSSRQALKWINETGCPFIESKKSCLKENCTKEHLEELLQEFNDFYRYLNECKQKVSLLGQLADNLIEKGHSHEVAIKKCVAQVKQSYQEFYMQLDRYKCALNEKQSLFADKISQQIKLDHESNSNFKEHAQNSSSVKDIIIQSGENRKSVRKRDYIMAELLRTEQTYVEDLKLCIDTYLRDFRSNDNLPASLVGKESLLFGNIEEIHQFHDRYSFFTIKFDYLLHFQFLFQNIFERT